MKKNLLLQFTCGLFILIFHRVFCQDESLRPCFLPTGGASFCVPSDRCRHIKTLLANLQKPLPGDISLFIKDSFFCPRSPSGEARVCCPLDGIDPPIEEKPKSEDLGGCVAQNGESSTCILYTRCSPFLQMLSNLKQPFPTEIPELMRGTLLCDVRISQGLSLPLVCCPTKAVNFDIPDVPADDLTDAERLQNHPNRAALALPGKCGLTKFITVRIVGGSEASLGAYPWLANLGFQFNGRNLVEFKCGGSLIGPKFVVTAAHCVFGLPTGYQLTTVRVGEHRLSTTPDCDDSGFCAPEPQDILIKNITFHPQYNSPNSFSNDIAILELEKPVVENDFVSPVCLPFNDNPSEDYKVSRSGELQAIHVAGWGATNEKGKNSADALQFLNVAAFDGEKCKDVYEERHGVIDPNNQICAGGEKGKDSCVGDSGSALMLEDKDADGSRFWKQIGLVSFGPRLCGTDGVPGVYTKIRSYMDWILDTVHV